MCDPQILRLPLEVLLIIFDYIAPQGPGLITHEDFAHLLAIRATCRMFRIVCRELNVWRAPFFHPNNFIPRLKASQEKFNPFDFELRATMFFDCLAADKSLMQRIGLKERWAFRSVVELAHIDRHVSTFRANLTHVYLEMYDCNRSEADESRPPPVIDINLAIEYLSGCPGLISLTIHTEQSDLSLESIVKSCPSLRKLELYCAQARGAGSLESLGQLQEYLCWVYNADQTMRNCWLPVASAPSLTSLQLDYVDGPPENVHACDSLLAFVNLTYFRIRPLTDEICDLIVRANFKSLRKFHAAVVKDSNITSNNLMKMFRAPSLRQLQALTFVMELFRPEFHHLYCNVINAITLLLRDTLEDLNLMAGMDVSCCQKFGSLHRLETMVLALPDIGINDETGEEETDARRNMLIEEIQGAFPGTVQPPEIEVVIVNEEEYELWDGMFD